MTTRTNDSEIDALPAREIHVVRGAAGTEHPVMLTIGVYGRSGRGGAAHGVLLKRDGALLLLRDLADALGVTLPARSLELPGAVVGGQIPAQRTDGGSPCSRI